MISLFPFRLKSFSLSTYLSIDATTLCALSLLCCLSTPFSMFSVLFYHASLMVNFLFSFFVFLFLHGSAQFSLVIYYFLNSLYYAWFIFSLLGLVYYMVGYVCMYPALVFLNNIYISWARKFFFLFYTYKVFKNSLHRLQSHIDLYFYIRSLCAICESICMSLSWCFVRGTISYIYIYI